MPEFRYAVPNLFVSDVSRAARYYEEKLGFMVVSRDGDPPAWVTVRRGDVRLGLFPAGPHVPAGLGWVYLTVEDVDDLYFEYTNAGVQIRSPLRQWGEHKEFSVTDPDGNRFDIGLPPE